MVHISELTPQKGERTITFGGTRAGKSSLTDMTMMEIQHERPGAMQILIDTKPRYRAENERGRRYTARKPAAYRYESWEAGPMIPNSCVVDIWDEHPFKGMWNEPGEIAIMQGAEFDDWRRMLQLLKGFVQAPVKNRERRVIVDECLDFTRGTHSGLTPETTYFIVPPAQGQNAESVSTWARTECTDSRRSYCKWPVESISSICALTLICGISEKLASKMLLVPRVVMCSGSIKYSRAGQYPSHSREGFNSQTGICPNCQIRKQSTGG